MFNALRCALRGHLFVDSRSRPGMQTCVRCRLRQPFESLELRLATPPGKSRTRV